MTKNMYREKEAREIYRIIKSRDSALVIGSSGIGKSAFAQSLLNKENQEKILGGAAAKNLVSICVNTDELPTLTSTEFYRLMLKRLTDCVEKARLPFKVIEQEKDIYEQESELFLIEKIKALIGLLQEATYQLFFVIDGLNLLAETLDPTFFKNLKSFRDLPRESFSFIFLGKSKVTDPAQLEKISPITYLFSANIIYLQPLDEKETKLRVEELAKMRDAKFSEDQIHMINRVSGGYPSLIKATVQYLSKDKKIGEKELISLLLGDNSVVSRLYEIYASLSDDEQLTLNQTIDGSAEHPDKQILASLAEKGIIKNGKTFSLIFADYVKRVKAKIPAAASPTIQLPQTAEPNHTGILIDRQTRRVYHDGQELENLTKQEFRLLNFLYENPNKVCNRDEVAEAVWETSEGVSEEAIDQLVTRLRAKTEIDKSNPTHLITIRGRGFMFKP